jgi:hypothetical protein
MNVSKLSNFTFALLASTAIGTFNVQAQENSGSAAAQSTRAEQAAYRDGFSVAPYIWLTYYSGTMTVNGQTIEQTAEEVGEAARDLALKMKTTYDSAKKSVG